VFGYDDSTYKYTIQKSGVYMFTASVTWFSSFDYKVELIYFNGDDNIVIGKMGDFFYSRNLNVIYNCIIGDQVYLRFDLYSVSRATLDTVSYFTGHSLLLT
jgi:hypothetical protein